MSEEKNQDPTNEVDQVALEATIQAEVEKRTNAKLDKIRQDEKNSHLGRIEKAQDRAEKLEAKLQEADTQRSDYEKRYQELTEKMEAQSSAEKREDYTDNQKQLLSELELLKNNNDKQQALHQETTTRYEQELQSVREEATNRIKEFELRAAKERLIRETGVTDVFQSLLSGDTVDELTSSALKVKEMQDNYNNNLLSQLSAEKEKVTKETLQNSLNPLAPSTMPSIQDGDYKPIDREALRKMDKKDREAYLNKTRPK